MPESIGEVVAIESDDTLSKGAGDLLLVDECAIELLSVLSVIWGGRIVASQGPLVGLAMRSSSRYYRIDR